MLATGSAVLPGKAKLLQNGLFLAISKQKNEQQLSLGNQTFPVSSLTSCTTGHCLEIKTNRNRKMNNMVVCCSLESGPASPFPFNLIPGSNWQVWILGIVISVFLPFTTSKWGPLLKLKNEADNIMETAEHIADVVEEVAEKVEKIADEVGDQLPEGGKLQSTLELVEDLAEEAAKNARLAGDLIDKVQEVEDKMEAFMESADAKGNEKPKEA